MTKKEVKSYLRIDIDDDDALLDAMMEAAEDYVKEAVGECDEENPRVNMLLLAIVQDMYDNRTFVASSTQGYSVSESMRHMISSWITQLQVQYDMDHEVG